MKVSPMETRDPAKLQAKGVSLSVRESKSDPGFCSVSLKDKWGNGGTERDRSVREVNKRYRNKGEIERVGDWIRGKIANWWRGE